MNGGLFAIEHSEILSALRTLGLDSGASQEDIRSAFRRLAKELHPDVTGQKSDFRFKQITGAYNILKNLSPEELLALSAPNPDYQLVRAEHQRQEETRRRQEASFAKIDSILDRYDRELKDYYTNHQTGSLDIQGAVLRLKSRNPGSLRAVLKHSAHLANRTEFRKALCELLNRPEIDSSCAEIIASLPFDAKTRKVLAADSAGNAHNLPVGLIISLMGNDSDVIESFLLHVRPEDFAAVLRRWPSGKTMNPNIVRRLLETEDPRVLVPVLSLMKGTFPQNAVFCRKRLSELEGHPTAAVRAWAKKLV